MEQRQLQIGDVVYGFYGGEIQSKQTITRVTKTQAVSGNGTRFKRHFTGNWVRAYVRVSFSRTSFEIATPDLDRKYMEVTEHNNAMREFWQINIEKLSTQQIKKIIEIAKQ